MKKILVMLFVIALLAAAVPIIGNKLVENALSEKIELLSANGIEVKHTISDNSYIKTKKHYEFLLRDSNKFLAYINQDSYSEIPSYLHDIIDGILLGADVTYSNIPFMNAITVDAYPMALPLKMMDEIQKEDAGFYAYINAFFLKKGILYHIEHDIVSKDFSGYIKDIDEHYSLKDGTNLTIVLSGMNYNGIGDLIAPNILNSKIDIISLKALKDLVEVKFDLTEFSSASEFESKSRYSSSVNLGNIGLAIKGDDNVSLYSKNIKMSIASDTQESFGQIYLQSSFKEMGIQTKEFNAKMHDFNYDISLGGLDKDALEELQDIMIQAKNTPSNSFELQIRESFIKLLSRGVTLGIDDLSFKNLLLNDAKDLNGVSIHSQIFFKEDPALANKLLYTPALLIQNLDTDIRIKISRAIVNKINESTPMAAPILEYAKEDGENLVFEILFRKGELLINGRVLKS